MSKVTSLEVEVKPVITVDQDTAYTCLKLLELYCKANDKIIISKNYDPQSYDFDNIIKKREDTGK